MGGVEERGETRKKETMKDRRTKEIRRRIVCISQGG